MTLNERKLTQGPRILAIGHQQRHISLWTVPPRTYSPPKCPTHGQFLSPLTTFPRLLKRTFENWHEPTLLTLTDLSFLYTLTAYRFIIYWEMVVVEEGNVLHHVKEREIVREGECHEEYVRREYVQGKMSGPVELHAEIQCLFSAVSPSACSNKVLLVTRCSCTTHADSSSPPPPSALWLPQPKVIQIRIRIYPDTGLRRIAPKI